MSATDAAPPPAATPPKQPPRVKLTPVDREFLPAALEILETPPSPVRMWLMLTICAFATAAIVWAFLSRIDIISVAQGKIQSVGRVKLVQPVETAKVRAVNVANGAHVSEGDVLVVLDDSEARADEDALVAALAAISRNYPRRSKACAPRATRNRPSARVSTRRSRRRKRCWKSNSAGSMCVPPSKRKSLAPS